MKPPRDVLAQALWRAVRSDSADWSRLPEFMQDVYRGHADLLLADETVWGELRGDH